MPNRLIVGVMISSLLLVGGGCAGKNKSPDVAPAAEKPAPAMEDKGAMMNTGEDKPLPAEVDVDSAVDDIIDVLGREVTDESSEDSALLEDSKDMEKLSEEAYEIE